MLRRDVLKLAAAAAPLAYAGRLWAAPQASTRLLVVFLRGAYDAANVVIPIGSDFYYEARPSIHIPRPEAAAGDNAALSLDAEWGLHPALKDSIYPLWKKGQVAFVPFAGAGDDLSRSHFETQDTIELGQPVQGSRNYRSGFLSRLYGELAGQAKPIAFTGEMPLSFRGGLPVANVMIDGPERTGVEEHQAQLIQQMYQGHALASSVAQGFQMRQDVDKASSEMMAASRGAGSARGFELAARRIGVLMKSTYNLAFVDVGGWDTHVNQGAVDGTLAQQLRPLGAGLAGFADELGPAAWNDTVVVVVSEFGRTFHENGDRGTDHGHGSAYWVLGGGIKGGRILGEQVKLSPETLVDKRDYPVLTDYRALMGGLFQRIYGLDQARLQTVFPKMAAKDLQIV